MRTLTLAKTLLPLSFLASLSLGCTADDTLDEEDLPGEQLKVDTGDDGKFDSSVEATILDFSFKGELLTADSWNTTETINDQLLYTIGHLNGTRGVGRLDRLVLSNIKTVREGEKTKVTYDARLPVAWGSKTNLPTRYDFILPRNVDYAGLEAFTTKYAHSCIDFGAHDVTSGSMWYYYRPKASGCTLADADVVRTTATAEVSAINSSGKYPEYHKVWEDGTLNVVAVFGKYEDNATSTSDAGIAAYNQFIGAIKTALAGMSPVTTPATLPASPGPGTVDVTLKGTLPGGKKIQVNVLLVDNVSTASTTFYNRYEELSTAADVIMYNGHAGLGQNVRALAQKGRFVAGKYVIVWMNGCDTYAYVDGSLAQKRAALNPDDPTGTKYMEIITNGMPSYFHSNSRAVMAMINGLLAFDSPKTYEQIFKNVDSSQVVLVTGDNDNVYYPGYDPGGVTPPTPTTWAGLTDSFTVARAAVKQFETPVLPVGSYRFELTGTGDGDLYVQKGRAPTTSSYVCRPYKNGSNETCIVPLTTPGKLFVMVRGYGTTSTVKLVGKVN
ncbi:MAG: PPC domain-containing protein [Deltaproteobacteria bacterium]|nr:PPC domain-containing protein [Deltaproteobacteria bacterium]